MEYTKVVDGTKVTIALEGRLDTETAPKLEKDILSELDGITLLTFDLSELEYISSAGLRVLLALKKAMIASGGDLCVKNMNEAITSIFEISGFDMVLGVR